MDAVLIENHGDAPFTPGRVEPATVAALTVVAHEIAARCPTTPLGINVLKNDARAALAIACAVGARFIRVNVHAGAVVADQGLVQSDAYATLRDRRLLGADVRDLRRRRRQARHPAGAGRPRAARARPRAPRPRRRPRRLRAAHRARPRSLDDSSACAARSPTCRCSSAAAPRRRPPPSCCRSPTALIVGTVAQARRRRRRPRRPRARPPPRRRRPMTRRVSHGCRAERSSCSLAPASAGRSRAAGPLRSRSSLRRSWPGAAR